MVRKRNDTGWDDLPPGMKFVLPHLMMEHHNYVRMSTHAKTLLNEFGLQFKGYNNGYLCASWKVMRARNFHSSNTLRKATLELEHYGWIVRTQQGDFSNKPNLHALTFRRVNEIKGKPLEIGPTLRPLDSWKLVHPEFVMPKPAQRKGSVQQKRAA